MTYKTETAPLFRVSSLIAFAPVLEPDLHDPHVEPRVLRQLLPHVPGRLGRRLVGLLEHLHLPRGDRRAGTLVAVSAICKRK